MINRRLALAAAPALLAAPALRAQGAWPSRPIRIIVPYTPGAAIDAMARLTVVETQPALEAFIRDDVARNAALLRLAGFQPE